MDNEQQSEHSPLLTSYLAELTLACQSSGKTGLPILDLACGQGRNGCYLIKQGLPVVFADINVDALAHVKAFLNHNRAHNRNKNQALASFWQQDFEQTTTDPLKNKQYGAVLVFRYLHRPLIDKIKQAIKPGGIIIYETFTREQAEFGRPKNPAFLLKPGELVNYFSDWKVSHFFEGIVEHSGNKQAISSIVAIKPQC